MDEETRKPFAAVITADRVVADEKLKEEQAKGHDAWIDQEGGPGEVTYLVMVRPD